MARIYIASSWRNLYFPEVDEPELMYKLFTAVVDNLPDLLAALAR